ncbi:MAG: hypothetical protein NTX86_00735 [Candidatus Dependentiae bacterium]|nr:hypothetical protein [Candidatus Dependentiae bacterium]
MFKKSLVLRIFSLLSTIMSYGIAKAICPICTIATGIGVGFSRRLGIDDTITGLWVGALIASTIAWTINILTSYGIRFIGRKPLVAFIYLLLFLWPLYYYNYIGIPGNTLCGYDKLLLGIIIGIITFTVGCLWYNSIKVSNEGHAYFPFQKVFMPVGLLIIMSILFYCITR